MSGQLTLSQQALLYGAALVVPFIASLLLTPVAGKLAHRYDILDHPSEERFHAKVTPYLGGLAVAFSVMIVGAFTASSSGELVTIVFGSMAMMVVGLEDDRREIRPGFKLIVEVACGLGLWLVGVQVTFFGIPVLDAAITVAWVVLITNAVNLLDNMDGLASGFAAIAATTFFVIAAFRGDYLVGAFALAVAGASLGFLRHNFPPARIFLGDAGSLLLGFLLAALALKLDLFDKPGVVRALAPILILGVPIFDTILVVITRVHEGRPVYVGGLDHSSHRLVSRGLSGRGVALSIYALQIALSLAALAMLYFSHTVAIAIAIVALIAAAGLMADLLRVRPHLLEAEETEATSPTLDPAPETEIA